MAGHSKFKNIQHRKGAQDKKRAKIFTKVVREIITAAKIGQPEPSNNPRLRAAITSARTHNLPKERIERAIASASEAGNNENYIEIRYEGFAPGGIAIIVEALTDNKNRTASDVRSAFTKLGGNLGETGSVSFMFDHVGIIQYPAKTASPESILDNAIIAGVRDVESNDMEHIIYTDVDNFSESEGFLIDKYGPPEESHIGWKPKEVIMIEDKDKAEKLLKLIDLLEESDDVQRVFGNYELSDEIYQELLSQK